MTETVGDWAAWIVTGISLALAAVLLCAVVFGAVQRRHERGQTVSEPRG